MLAQQREEMNVNNNYQLHVSQSAVVQRVNRKLKREMKALRKARGAYRAGFPGDFYVVNFKHGGIVQTHVDVEDLARKLGVLKPWEEVASA
jgi:hypothetical protein